MAGGCREAADTATGDGEGPALAHIASCGGLHMEVVVVGKAHRRGAAGGRAAGAA